MARWEPPGGPQVAALGRACWPDRMTDAPLRRAIELACDSVAAGGGPFGAVIVRDGVTVAEGVNRVTLAHDPTAHAEIVAIRAACAALGTHDLSGCTLFASCEPCPMCAAAIHWARLQRVVFAADRHDAAAAGFDDALLYRQVPLPPAERALPHARALAAEGMAPFALWRAKPDRTPY